MTGMQVRRRITQEFPQLDLDRPTFMKCVSLKMVCVDVEGGGYPNGTEIQNIASKESLYMVETSKVSDSLLKGLSASSFFSQ